MNLFLSPLLEEDQPTHITCDVMAFLSCKNSKGFVLQFRPYCMHLLAAKPPQPFVGYNFLKGNASGRIMKQLYDSNVRNTDLSQAQGDQKISYTYRQFIKKVLLYMICIDIRYVNYVRKEIIKKDSHINVLFYRFRLQII